MSTDHETDPSESQPTKRSFWNTEDWWAIAVGGFILAFTLLIVILSQPAGKAERLAAMENAQRQLDTVLAQTPVDPAARKEAETAVTAARKKLAVNPLSGWVAKLSEWESDPTTAFKNSKGQSNLPALAATLGILGILFGMGACAMGRSVVQFVPGFIVLALLAVFSQMLADQSLIKHYNLEYALWALMTGLIISNTVGTPTFLMSAANTEFYIKTGLVLLGAEVLFHRLLELGLPGVFVSWVVTPVVLISTFIFGQRVLKIESPSLNMVISADMSVCGVSAAIATAAACRAKKEELSLAIGLSLAFTVIMMIAMPAFIRAVGMNSVVAGAWLGGTIDSTGAVAAAGGMLDATALQVAVMIKMIQNILIGVVAFGVAAYWVTYMETSPETSSRPGLSEIWRRFPRFILGFLGASIIFSMLSAQGRYEEALAGAVVDGVGKGLRGWCFCLAFVSIGLETDFRVLSKYLAGGKPLVLYVCGQALNLLLTFVMAWLMFEKVFPDASRSLINR